MALVAVLTGVAAVQTLVVGVVCVVVWSVALPVRAAEYGFATHAVQGLHRLRYVVGTCKQQNASVNDFNTTAVVRLYYVN